MRRPAKYNGLWQFDRCGAKEPKGPEGDKKSVHKNSTLRPKLQLRIKKLLLEAVHVNENHAAGR